MLCVANRRTRVEDVVDNRAKVSRHSAAFSLPEPAQRKRLFDRSVNLFLGQAQRFEEAGNILVSDRES